MKYTDLFALINEKLDGDRVTDVRLLKYVDEVIDDINEALSSVYPTFTENKSIPGYDGTYTLFPDKYLRSVVAVGAAYKYYITESEGDGVAGSYGSQYNAALFVMKRDFMESVPEIFQNLTAGVLKLKENTYLGMPTVSEMFPGVGATDISYILNRISELEARVTALEAE